MNIGGRYSITSDANNWIVTPLVIASKGKNAGETINGQPTFHSTLLQACKRVVELDASAAAACGLQAVVDAVRDAHDDLAASIAAAGLVRGAA